MTHAYRSHTCGQLRAEHAGSTTRISGWVHRVRDHGGVLFLDVPARRLRTRPSMRTTHSERKVSTTLKAGDAGSATTWVKP